MRAGIRRPGRLGDAVTIFAGKRETLSTYSALIPVVGGVVLASGVEPSLHVLGAAVCVAGALFRGIRAVLQAMLLQPHEKLDSMSCLAYMSPMSSAMLFVLTIILEPASLRMQPLLDPNTGMLTFCVTLANCAAAFMSNYYNMATTKRTSALTIQVLGQCKGILAAVVGTLCFHNTVPFLGWVGYLITCAGCVVYGRSKASAAAAAATAAAANTAAARNATHEHSATAQNAIAAPLRARNTSCSGTLCEGHNAHDARTAPVITTDHSPPWKSLSEEPSGWLSTPPSDDDGTHFVGRLWRGLRKVGPANMLQGSTASAAQSLHGSQLSLIAAEGQSSAEVVEHRGYRGVPRVFSTDLARSLSAELAIVPMPIIQARD